MKLRNYLNLLSTAEKMKGNQFMRFVLSEYIDKLVLNYPKIFKAADNDKGDLIYNRVMSLIEA